MEAIQADIKVTVDALAASNRAELQVLAAVKGVNTGLYIERIREYEEMEITPELEHLKKKLGKMTVDFEKVAEEVHKKDDDEVGDFHARRLVEMAGNIIMGHLLVLDAQREKSYKYLAELFIKVAVSENDERISYIRESELRDLGTYRQIITDNIVD